jgi:hypothetical protein
MNSFTHYTKRNFTWDTNYSANYFWEADKEVTLTFRYNTADIPENLYVKLNGALTAEGVTGSNLTQTSEYSTGNRMYKVADVGTTGTVSIKVKVADIAGLTAAVTLSANHYETNTQCTGTTGRWVDKDVTTTSSSTVTNTVNRTFARSDFSSTWNVTKTDINLTLSNCVRTNDYISLGSDGATNFTQGTVQVSGLPNLASTTTSGNVTTETSNPWVSKVVFTYTTNNNNRYAQGNEPTVTGATSSSYSRSGNVGTWTGRAEGNLTFTMPYAYRSGNYWNYTYYGKRMTQIVVTYSYDVTTTTSTTTTQHMWVTTED